MRTVFKTDNLFGRDLPPMLESYATAYRWHFADLAAMPLYETVPATAWDSQVWNDSARFFGVPMSAAIRLAKEGWPEGAEKARRLHEGIQASLPQRRRLAQYNVAGAVPNVARAIAGNPLNMRRLVLSETAQRPVIALVCDVCVDSLFPAARMIDHAAAVAAVADFLEEAGFRCEVITLARVKCRAIGAEVAVKIKAAEQPVNLSTLAFGLGHTSLFRRLMFGIWFADPDCGPLGPTLSSVEKTPAAPELGTYTVSAASAAGSSATAPERFRFVLRELAHQGCPGIPEDMQEAA